MEKNRVRNAKAGALFLSGIAAVALQIPPASAADYGLGVSHGNDSAVMVPIRLESLTIEPEVFYSRSKTKGESDTGSINSTFTSYGIATGIYARRTLGPSFESYFGGRVGISKFRISSDSGTTFSLQQKGDLWFAGPTVGLEYYFSKHFSIALDASLLYDHSKNKFAAGLTDQSSTSKSVDTATRMLLRGYF
jgi:hypothetical protein